MQRVNEYRFYVLGKSIAAIQQIGEESLYADVWFSLWHARDQLTQLRSDSIGMRVSIPTLDALVSAINVIVPTRFNEAFKKVQASEPDTPVKVGIFSYDLGEAVKAFEPVMAAECQALDTYVVSQKRGYSTPDLVDRCEVMLPAETIALLTPGIVADLRAAGRCLAFDTPTAAGFHVLRAVEAVMAIYYKHVTGKDLARRNRNWGAYLKALEAVPTAAEKVRGALHHIKDNYRNPITHPEDTLTEGEAVMLFGISVSVIELMADPLRHTSPVLTEVAPTTSGAEPRDAFDDF